MNDPNEGNQANFQEPPDVKVIEASCKQSNQRTDDNGTWTTVLKNPITIKKGDEIRAVASYIDCPGIDQEIIQFTRSGQEQDNTHTLLTQMYTVNDGFQQKTTSYDYMCRAGFLTIQPGGSSATPAVVLPTAVGLPANVEVELRTFNEDGSPAGVGCICQGYDPATEMLIGGQIVNGGTGYENGDFITWTGSTTKVVLFVDGQGVVKSFHITENGVGTVDANKVFHTRNTDAKDLNIVFSYSLSGGAANKVLNCSSLRPNLIQPLTGPNGKYKPGQIAQVWLVPTSGTAAGFPLYTGATCRINNIYKGNPGAAALAVTEANMPSYFDQGYNYQRIPLQRWSQTYENTSKFCFGRGYQRKYTASDNIEYNLNNPAKINQKDLLLSASMICRNKEDEFVSGVFHKQHGSDLTLEGSGYQSNNYRTSIELNANNSTFIIGRETDLDLLPENTKKLGIGRILIQEINKKEFPDSNLPLTQNNSTDITYYLNSILCPGMVVDIRFKLDIPDNDARDTNANQLLVYQEFDQKWGGVYPIGSQELITGTKKFMRNYIGVPAQFDSTGGSDLNETNSFKNYNVGSPTDLEFGKFIDADAGLGIGATGVTFLCRLDESPISGMVAGSCKFPGDTDYTDNFIQVECNTFGVVGSPGNPAGPGQKTPGAIAEVYFQGQNLLPTKGWTIGQSLRSVAPGEITPPGVTFNELSAATQQMRFIISTTDPCGGADFGTYEQLTQAKMSITGGIPVKMLITPVPYYMSGLQTFYPGGANDVNPNGFATQRETATLVLDRNGANMPISQGGQYFQKYNNFYPPTFPECFDLSRGEPGGADTTVGSINPNCILYKPGGQNKDLPEAKDINKVYSFHDKDQELQVKNMLSGNDWGQSVEYQFTVGPDTSATGDHIINANNIITGGPNAQSSFTFNLPAITHSFPELSKLDDLPIHSLMVLEKGLVFERPVMMGGFGTETSPGLYKIQANSKCVPQTVFYGFNLPTVTEDGVTAMANIDIFNIFSQSEAQGFEDIDTSVSGYVRVAWIKNPNQVNSGFLTTFKNKNKGSIAYTSSQNFYGAKDQNLTTEKLLAFNNWKYIMGSNGISQQGLASYSKGGFYFLTQATGIVDKPGTDIPYRDFFGFSQGYSEFVLYNGENDSTSVYNKATSVYNNILPFLGNPFASTPVVTHALANNATMIYGYEPLYNQKTFIMDRNFVVPSDIASKWDTQSHLIGPTIDRDTGEELSSKEETGLIQNEFIHPVYGSNNFIDSGGEYIKDTVLFPYSGGLQGGHCIGVAFLDKNQQWLNPNLVPSLPKWYGDIAPNISSDGVLTHYKVYFRTPFTQLRNYDPVKINKQNANNYYNGAAGQLGIPDRTPLHTLQTQARNIGNTSIIGATQVAPQPNIPSKTVKLIDGQTMSFVEDPTQQANPAASGTTTALYDQNQIPNKTTISELMDVIPNQTDLGPVKGSPPVPPAGYTAGTSTNFPDSPFAYPVRYIDNTVDGKFDRALASQFCGTTNPTLAFQTDLSAFTFQFFYQPYTSPFVDGEGGDLATRIFYGNRKDGIYNHDSLGGIVVWNWAKPNYPRGVMSQGDLDDPNLLSYPNGIKPFESVAVIGKRFLNKLGFSDSDLDITNQSKINSFNPVNTGFSTTSYQKDIVMDGGTTSTIQSLDVIFKGTNFSLLDTSDAILSAIDAPENSASLHKNNTLAISSMGLNNNPMRQMNGDYIFYPYSLSTSTDSFQSSTASVRFDNCTDAYGSVGGLRLSNVARGMGLPNTQGSTSIVDQKSIPVTLNVDCNLYLSYSASTENSNLIRASGLPKKMNHGHLIVLSSLIEEPNFIMAKIGAINGISLISKAFLTGDFILSNGMLSWYAKKDRVISEITTRIVNTNYETPTVLGNNSTVVYSITNNNPKPADRPNTIFEIQQNDYEIMDTVNAHLAAVGQGQGSPLTQLESQLDSLGIGVIENGDRNKSANLISELRNQINAFGLTKLNPTQRREFFQTPAGSAFIQNASAMRGIMSNLRDTEQDQMNIDDGLGDDALIAQHNRNIRNISQELQREGRNARERMADIPYVIPPDVEPGFDFRRDEQGRITIERGRANIPGEIKPLVFRQEAGITIPHLPQDVETRKGDGPESGIGESIQTRSAPIPSQKAASTAPSAYTRGSLPSIDASSIRPPSSTAAPPSYQSQDPEDEKKRLGLKPKL